MYKGGLFGALFFAALGTTFADDSFPDFPGFSSSDGEPPKRNTGFLVTFLILFLFLGFVNFVGYIKRRSKFGPILNIHKNRTDKAFDFTAFGRKTRQLTDMVKAMNEEEILWADVSLLIPSCGDVAFILIPTIFGIIVVSAITVLLPEFAVWATPVLIVALIPSIYQLFISYQQIFGDNHFTALNVLTPRGAHITEFGKCGPSSKFYAYKDMSNIHFVETYDDCIGNVIFAEHMSYDTVHEASNGRINERKEWVKHAIGFMNVVQPMEVRDILVERTAIPATGQPLQQIFVNQVTQPAISAVQQGTGHTQAFYSPQSQYVPSSYAQPSQGGYASQQSQYAQPVYYAQPPAQGQYAAQPQGQHAAQPQGQYAAQPQAQPQSPPQPPSSQPPV